MTTQFDLEMDAFWAEVKQMEQEQKEIDQRLDNLRSEINEIHQETDQILNRVEMGIQQLWVDIRRVEAKIGMLERYYAPKYYEEVVVQEPMEQYTEAVQSINEYQSGWFVMKDFLSQLYNMTQSHKVLA